MLNRRVLNCRGRVVEVGIERSSIVSSGWERLEPRVRVRGRGVHVFESGWYALYIITN